MIRAEKMFRSGMLIILCALFISGCTHKNQYVIDARGNKGKETETVQGAQGTSNSNAIDPFEGLVVDFDGISPFCTVSFNNSRCSEAVQINVEYSLSPDTTTTEGYFSLGDDVTVYAFLKNKYDDTQEYFLSKTSKTYQISDVPQYITEITPDMDLTNLKNEAHDYLESITAFKAGDAIGDWIAIGDQYNNTWGHYKSSKDPVLNKIYFSALKRSSYSQYPSEKAYFNRIDITYSIAIKGEEAAFNDKYQNRYFTIIAKNIVQYPDGTIGWGKSNPADLDFEHNIDWTNMESLINVNITANKADYNVTDISEYWR